MRFVQILTLLFLLSFNINLMAQEDHDAVKWFKSAYAPLWDSVDNLDADKISQAFASSFHELQYEGGYLVHTNSEEFWAERFKSYREGGWTGGTLSSVTAYAYSPGTALLEVRWLQKTTEGIYPGCFVYTVNGSGEDWKIISAAAIKCEDQKLSELLKKN